MKLKHKNALFAVIIAIVVIAVYLFTIRTVLFR